MTGRIECDGGPYCKASPHMHGCFADKGDCDHPEEHRSGAAPNRSPKVPDGDPLDRIESWARNEGRAFCRALPMPPPTPLVKIVLRRRGGAS